MDAAPPRSGGTRTILALVALVVVLVIGAWVFFRMRANDRTLQQTQSALKLQVLTSRLGIGALEAEYGNYDNARSVVSGVFDGIRNYGIERGSLPENFATVLAARDRIITALARSDPSAQDELTALFFRLQIPVETKLDPRYIIPAADSGVGLEPPRKKGSPPADSTAHRSDSTPGHPDTMVAPDTTSR